MRIPPRIALGPIGEIVGISIHFDRNPRLEARKIQRIRSLRALLAELESSGSLLQRPPEDTLWRAHLLSQLARQRDGLAGRTDGAVSGSQALFLPGTGMGTRRSLVEGSGPRRPLGPTTTRLRRAVPLPVPGRNEAHPCLRWISAVRSIVQTVSSRWFSIRCSKVTIPASGRDAESLSAITSVSARSVSPMKTGLGIRTLS